MSPLSLCGDLAVFQAVLCPNLGASGHHPPSRGRCSFQDWFEADTRDYAGRG